MDILRVNGGKPLSGKTVVQGAKNSVLPIMAASILACGETIVHNCPNLSDVTAAIKILKYLGCKVERQGGTIFIDSKPMTGCDIPDNLMREMRSSVIFLGAILGRTGQAKLSQPGGCELGPRPIDMHVSALRQLGGKISEFRGQIICSADKLQGSHIHFRLPSVGATENAMLAACCCEGKTIITNAACEPEIVDLQMFLKKLGAQISGAGTPSITIEGEICKEHVEHTVISDRIAAATYLCAAASAGGDICIEGVTPEHISTVTDELMSAGCSVTIHNGDSIQLTATKPLRAIGPVSTKPYPGFPTDAQPPLMASVLCAAGTSAFIENIFENRFRHVEELRRMGADIKTEGKVAMVSGVKKLFGASVTATDLRGGAALAIAAVGAEGQTDIYGLRHIDRGYDNIEQSLCELGADIKRIKI